MRKIALVAALPGLLAVVSAQAQYSAKSLFFGTEGEVVSVAAPASVPATPVATADKSKPAKVVKTAAAAKPKQAKHLGASYFVRLKRPDGTMQDVLASREFKSGERFQIGLKVNGPTYVYISNIGPDGSRTTLFPAAGQDGLIDAMGVVMLPPKGAFEFDDVPGVEQLSVTLSPTPLSRETLQDPAREPDFVQHSAAGMRQASEYCRNDASPQLGASVAVASLDASYASKGIQLSSEQGPTACAAVQQSYASKGIVVSDDPAPEAGGQVASYVVKKTTRPSDSLTINLNLQHR